MVLLWGLSCLSAGNVPCLYMCMTVDMGALFNARFHESIMCARLLHAKGVSFAFIN